MFPPFRPHPLVRGGHLQTLAGVYLPSRITIDGTLHHVCLPDGDAIALHDDGLFSTPLAGTKPGPGELLSAAESPLDRKLLASGYCDGVPIALLLHGLCGSNQSGYMLRVSTKLRERGVRVFRMDLRGCGAGTALARHPLHAGRSEDAHAALDYIAQLCPGQPIHLVGFSMGANIVLKLAGELGAAAPSYLASVTAISPPIDLAACTRNIQRGANQFYDRKFVRLLNKHVRQRTSLVPGALTRPLTPSPRRLQDFDSLFTAPLSGFADVHDYYARASSAPLLSHITVPTLIIAAASDPIVPVSTFESARLSFTTQLHIAPCGGHLGFISAKSGDPDLRWLDWRIVEWITSQAPRRTR
jgi:predicted alpha/beta-fold hydrolase